MRKTSKEVDPARGEKEKTKPRCALGRFLRLFAWALHHVLPRHAGWLNAKAFRPLSASSHRMIRIQRLHKSARTRKIKPPNDCVYYQTSVSGFPCSFLNFLIFSFDSFRVRPGCSIFLFIFLGTFYFFSFIYYPLPFFFLSGALLT